MQSSFQLYVLGFFLFNKDHFVLRHTAQYHLHLVLLVQKRLQLKDSTLTFISSCNLRSFFELGSTMVRTSFSSKRSRIRTHIKIPSHPIWNNKLFVMIKKKEKTPLPSGSACRVSLSLRAVFYLAWCPRGPAHSGRG